MAIVQISKIQHRTGANTDLPQLDIGEIGFSTDTRQVFIGNDPVLVPIDTNVSFTTQTELLTEVSLINQRVPNGPGSTRVFAPISGAGNTVFNIQNIRTGQLIIGDGDGVAANTLVNWTGNLIGNGINHPTNKLKLGNASNIMINGGTNGSVLSTDGSGNLSWQSISGEGGSLPLQTGSSGKFLTTDGTIASWSNTLPSWGIANVRSNLSVTSSGDSSLVYNTTTGVFTYTGSNSTQVRSYFSAGTGITYSATGQISIGQDVSTTSNVTFDDITGSNITLLSTSPNAVLYTSPSGSIVSSESDFTYNSTTNTLEVGKLVTIGAIEVGTLFKSNITTQTGTSTGTQGQICWDANYIYVCTSTNVWKRVALTAF